MVAAPTNGPGVADVTLMASPYAPRVRRQIAYALLCALAALLLAGCGVPWVRVPG